MGSLQGHLLPGSMFMVISAWWFIGETLQKGGHRRYYDRSRGRFRGSRAAVQPVWYSCPGARLSAIPVEPILKVVFAVLGVLAELFAGRQETLYDKDGELIAQHLDNYTHAVMYGFFGLSGVVDLVMWFDLFPLPPKFDYLIVSLALSFEGLLFCFHLHGRDELNVRLHTFLYILVFVTAAVFFLAVISDQFFHFVGFLRAYLLSLQGSWFFQAGFVLFGPNPWQNSPSSVEFLSIVFAFHALTWFVVHLILRIVCYHCYTKKNQLNGSLSEEESSGEEADCVMLGEL